MNCTDLVVYRDARDELRAALAAALPPERRRVLAEWVQAGAPDPGATMPRTPITLRLDPETLAALDALAADLAADPRARALAYGGRVTRQDAARYALQRGLEAVGVPAEPAPDERPRPKRTRKPAPSAKPEADADAEDPELAAAFVELESRLGTLQAIADKLEVDLSSVSRWRSGGRKPRPKARAQILELAGE